MDDDLPPELDDFTEVIEKIQPKEDSQQYEGDYTQTRDQIEKEFQDKVQIELQKKMAAQQLESIEKQEELKKKQEEEKKQPKKKSSGFQKGFLLGNKDKKKTTANKGKQEITEVKVSQEKQKKNALEIDEVQKSMDMKNFMNQSKDQWMTPDLLGKIAKNPKLQKLFTNPEYMQAIGLMQTNPQKAKEMYGNNPEFNELFQEFCNMMGVHFQGMSEEDKNKQEKQKTEQYKQQQQQPQGPMIQEIKKPTKEDIKHQEFEQKLKDPQVMQVMQDPQVQQFIQYLQKSGNYDFRQLLAQNPALGQKIQFLINSGVINLQSG